MLYTRAMKKFYICLVGATVMYLACKCMCIHFPAQGPGSAVASVIVIVVVAAMVAAAVIIIIVIWKRKYAGKFRPVTAQGLAMGKESRYVTE